jgi:hypothetical protein
MGNVFCASGMGRGPVVAMVNSSSFFQVGNDLHPDAGRFEFACVKVFEMQQVVEQCEMQESRKAEGADM